MGVKVSKAFDNVVSSRPQSGVWPARTPNDNDEYFEDEGGELEEFIRRQQRISPHTTPLNVSVSSIGEMELRSSGLFLLDADKQLSPRRSDSQLYRSQELKTPSPDRRSLRDSDSVASGPYRSKSPRRGKVSPSPDPGQQTHTSEAVHVTQEERPGLPGGRTQEIGVGARPKEYSFQRRYGSSASPARRRHFSGESSDENTGRKNQSSRQVHSSSQSCVELHGEDEGRNVDVDLHPDRGRHVETSHDPRGLSPRQRRSNSNEKGRGKETSNQLHATEQIRYTSEGHGSLSDISSGILSDSADLAVPKEMRNSPEGQELNYDSGDGDVEEAQHMNTDHQRRHSREQQRTNSELDCQIGHHSKILHEQSHSSGRQRSTSFEKDEGNENVSHSKILEKRGHSHERKSGSNRQSGTRDNVNYPNSPRKRRHTSTSSESTDILHHPTVSQDGQHRPGRRKSTSVEEGGSSHGIYPLDVTQERRHSPGRFRSSSFGAGGISSENVHLLNLPQERYQSPAGYMWISCDEGGSKGSVRLVKISQERHHSSARHRSTSYEEIGNRESVHLLNVPQTRHHSSARIRSPSYERDGSRENVHFLNHPQERHHSPARHRSTSYEEIGNRENVHLLNVSRTRHHSSARIRSPSYERGGSRENVHFLNHPQERHHSPARHRSTSYEEGESRENVHLLNVPQERHHSPARHRSITYGESGSRENVHLLNVLQERDLSPTRPRSTSYEGGGSRESVHRLNLPLKRRHSPAQENAGMENVHLSNVHQRPHRSTSYEEGGSRETEVSLQRRYSPAWQRSTSFGEDVGRENVHISNVVRQRPHRSTSYEEGGSRHYSPVRQRSTSLVPEQRRHSPTRQKSTSFGEFAGRENVHISNVVRQGPHRSTSYEEGGSRHYSPVHQRSTSLVPGERRHSTAWQRSTSFGEDVGRENVHISNVIRQRPHRSTSNEEGGSRHYSPVRQRSTSLVPDERRHSSGRQRSISVEKHGSRQNICHTNVLRERQHSSGRPRSTSVGKNLSRENVCPVPDERQRRSGQWRLSSVERYGSKENVCVVPGEKRHNSGLPKMTSTEKDENKEDVHLSNVTYQRSHSSTQLGSTGVEQDQGREEDEDPNVCHQKRHTSERQRVDSVGRENVERSDAPQERHMAELPDVVETVGAGISPHHLHVQHDASGSGEQRPEYQFPKILKAQAKERREKKKREKEEKRDSQIAAIIKRLFDATAITRKYSLLRKKTDRDAMNKRDSQINSKQMYEFVSSHYPPDELSQLLQDLQWLRETSEENLSSLSEADRRDLAQLDQAMSGANTNPNNPEVIQWVSHVSPDAGNPESTDDTDSSTVSVPATPSPVTMEDTEDTYNPTDSDPAMPSPVTIGDTDNPTTSGLAVYSPVIMRAAGDAANPTASRPVVPSPVTTGATATRDKEATKPKKVLSPLKRFFGKNASQSQSPHRQHGDDISPSRSRPQRLLRSMRQSFSSRWSHSEEQEEPPRSRRSAPSLFTENSVLSDQGGFPSGRLRPQTVTRGRSLWRRLRHFILHRRRGKRRSESQNTDEESSSLDTSFIDHASTGQRGTDLTQNQRVTDPIPNLPVLDTTANQLMLNPIPFSPTHSLHSQGRTPPSNSPVVGSARAVRREHDADKREKNSLSNTWSKNPHY